MRSGAALTASLPLCVAAVGQHHSQAAVRAQGCTQADRAKINLCSVTAETEHSETSMSSAFIWSEWWLLSFRSLGVLFFTHREAHLYNNVFLMAN